MADFAMAMRLQILGSLFIGIYCLAKVGKLLITVFVI